MAERKYTHGLRVYSASGCQVIDIGDMEIWDGADLSLLRDALVSLIKRERKGSIGVDMRAVQYVPSGFFGMLFDWYESGIQVRLIAPQARVMNMLWFRQFFRLVEKDVYELNDRGVTAPVASEAEEAEWAAERWSEIDSAISSVRTTS
jgi:hypothetical protein